jgi:hypothetical protein
MAGEPDENDDVLSFGNTDRGRAMFRPGRTRPRPDRVRPRSDRMRLHLDRLTLRLTRRPRLAAATAGLAAVALAGLVVYLAVSTHPGASSALVAPSSPRQEPVDLRVPAACVVPGLPTQMGYGLIKFLQQQMSSPPAYSSSLTIHLSTPMYGAITVNPTTGQVSCTRHANG